MARSCLACGHPEREAIDAALAAGDSTRAVASRFGLSQPGVNRHAKHGKESGGVKPRTESTDARARVAQDEPPKRHRSTPSMVDAALLEVEAVRLRRAGKNYREIAEILGVPPGTCCSAVHRVIKRANEEANESAEIVRALELDRLDALEASLWGRATNPECAVVMVPADGEVGCRPYDGQDKAVDRIIKIKERRAKLLGLDEPNRVDVTTGGAPLLGVKPLSQFTDAELQALAERAELPAEKSN